MVPYLILGYFAPWEEHRELLSPVYALSTILENSQYRAYIDV